MNAANRAPGSAAHRADAYRQTPHFMQFESLDPGEKKLWTVSFESEILTLIRPDNTVVLKLHRDEAARYMRFEYDLFRGLTISLIIIEGLKKYSFRCHRAQVMKMLAWLPHLTAEERTRQIRYSAIVLALLGLFHLALPQYLLWVWGIALLAVGLVGVLRARPAMFAANGIALFLAGLWDLLTGTPHEIRPWNVPPEARIIPVIVGSIIILWAIQQVSMLGPNKQLRAARIIRDQRASFLPGVSRLVRRIGYANLAASFVFAAYALAMLLTAPIRAKALTVEVIRGLNPAWHDGIIFGVLALLAFSSALLFLRQGRPLYFEAKVSAQLLISIVVFSLWAVAFNIRPSAPFAQFGGLFALNLTLFSRTYVWISLLVCVLAFNRWFGRAVDRELEEQRG